MYSKEKYPLQDETHKIIGTCMEVHKILGKGLQEVVYKDALEQEFKFKNIKFEREKNIKLFIKELNFLINFMQILLCLIK